MNPRIRLHPVCRWETALGKQSCPYASPLGVVRWFFYHRFRQALKAAGTAENATVLDVGCWEGHFLPSLLDNYARVCAIDDDSASAVEYVPGKWTTLQSAKELCQAEGFPVARLLLAKADGAALPFLSGSFDSVFSLDTLPFVPAHHRDMFLAELRRVLKVGGKAVFTLPVEMGVAVMIREMLRRCCRSWPHAYSLKDFLRAIFYVPRQRMNRRVSNFIGYDYRQDEALIRRYFYIEHKHFLPATIFTWISPTVLLCASAVHELREKSPKSNVHIR
jgi:SAM-dependent methyltransferase